MFTPKIIPTACKADANPSNLTYKWFLNEKLVEGNETELVSIINITIKHRNTKRQQNKL